MENSFLICCHDSLLIGSRSECDRLQCQENHDPAFNVSYHKVNNRHFYCFSRNQLGQYWKCVVEDREVFALADVINVVFVKKCLMFFLNCRQLFFFIQKLLWLIIMMKLRINLFCGVYLLVHLIKETKDLELK